MTARSGAFIATKEHRRFIEFADAVRKHRYIGLCYGAAGVGKTLSARRYARWEVAEPFLDTWGPRQPSDAKIYGVLAQSCSVFYTPAVACSLRVLRNEVTFLTVRMDACLGEHHASGEGRPTGFARGLTELLIVDEAERLSTTGLEHLRDVFDRTGIGVILIGMP
ncbi:AAA family ATPase, partial [Methylobacterium persicinum]